MPLHHPNNEDFFLWLRFFIGHLTLSVDIVLLIFSLLVQYLIGPQTQNEKPCNKHKINVFPILQLFSKTLKSNRYGYFFGIMIFAMQTCETA